MSNKIKEIYIYKNRAYHFFDDMISIKNLDLYKIKIDEKSYKNIVIYHIGYVTIKNLHCIKTNSVNPLYLILSKINGYIEKNNEDKYLPLVPTDESKDTLQKNEELWDIIRDLARSITMKIILKSNLIHMMIYL